MPLDPTDEAMVDKLERKMEPLKLELLKYQGMVNTIFEMAGEPRRYSTTEDCVSAATKPKFKTYGRGEFYGKPLASAVRQVIEDNGGALTAEEIHVMLTAGGFKFMEDDAAKQVNNLKISLGKNSAFDRTSNGTYVISDGRSKRKSKDGVGATGKDADRPILEGEGSSQQPPDETALADLLN